MNFVSSNLKDILTKTVNDMHFPRDVQVELSVNSCVIQCDVVKIKGIITNLLQNSIQAMKSNGKINILTKDLGDSVQIDIVDSGPGIPPENTEKIFEAMFTTKPLGNGLGLSSCRELLEKHGGTISVKNNPTTFMIVLPKKIPVTLDPNHTLNHGRKDHA